MDLLENLRMLLLNFNSIIIDVIHRILALIKNHLNYLKDDIFECFFKTFIFFRKLIFFIIYNNGKFNS